MARAARGASNGTATHRRTSTPSWPTSSYGRPWPPQVVRIADLAVAAAAWRPAPVSPAGRTPRTPRAAGLLASRCRTGRCSGARGAAVRGVGSTSRGPGRGGRSWSLARQTDHRPFPGAVRGAPGVARRIAGPRSSVTGSSSALRSGIPTGAPPGRPQLLLNPAGRAGGRSASCAQRSGAAGGRDGRHECPCGRFQVPTLGRRGSGYPALGRRRVVVPALQRTSGDRSRARAPRGRPAGGLFRSDALLFSPAPFPSRGPPLVPAPIPRGAAGAEAPGRDVDLRVGRHAGRKDRGHCAASAPVRQTARVPRPGQHWLATGGRDDGSSARTASAFKVRGPQLRLLQ